jgi:hypothetical protein
MTRVINRDVVSQPEEEWKPYAPLDGRGGKVFRKAMAIAEEIHMTQEERYELALLVPSVDKDGTGSWKNLSAKELETVLTMLEGFVYIEALLSLRPLQEGET